MLEIEDIVQKEKNYKTDTTLPYPRSIDTCVNESYVIIDKETETFKWVCMLYKKRTMRFEIYAIPKSYRAEWLGNVPKYT